LAAKLRVKTIEKPVEKVEETKDLAALKASLQG